MKILKNTQEVRKRYEALLDLSPSASVYQTIGWLEVFETISCELMFVEAGGEALIPFLCKGKGAFRRAFSLPYDTYGGPVGTHGRSVCYHELLSTLNVPSMRLVDFSNRVEPSEGQTEKVSTYLVDLTPGYDEVQKAYSTMNRRAIRQAHRRDLQIRPIGGIGELPLFYRLYRNTLRRYGTPPLPLRFFQGLYHRMVMKDRARFYMAWHDDRVVAANLVLRFKDKAYDWTWVYDGKFLHLRPTNALIDRAIQDEINAGSTVFNLGSSPLNGQGIMRFKENFGATEYNYRIHSTLGRVYQAARLLKSSTRRLTRRIR